jgi:hypothetical protein
MTGEAMFAESFLGFVDLAEGLWAEARGRGVRILRHIIPRQAFMTLSMSLPFLTALFLEVGDLADARDAWQLAANVPLARRSPLAQRLVLGRLADALAAAEDLPGPRTLDACLAAGRDVDPYPVLESLLAKLEQMAEQAPSTEADSSATMEP